jgi:opacity protein-like surface antigen
MNMRKGMCLFVLSGLLSLTAPVSFAHTNPNPPDKDGLKSGFMPANLRGVFAFFGGYAGMNAASSQRFYGTDSELFTYANQGNGAKTGFLGGLIGGETQLPWAGYFLQAGLEYSYFSNIDVIGLNSVGIEPSTATTYQYQYHFRTQQVLIVSKLLASMHETYHPYATVGIGAAFNNSGQYSVATTQQGGVNLTAQFNNNAQTAFSYILGLGIDADIRDHLRVGLGYQFSGLGKATLGAGQVTFNNYQAQLPYTLGKTNAFANQLIAQITYLA